MVDFWFFQTLVNTWLALFHITKYLNQNRIVHEKSLSMQSLMKNVDQIKFLNVSYRFKLKMCANILGLLDRLLSHKLLCLTKILEINRREDEMTGILNIICRISILSTPDLNIQICYRIFFWMDTLSKPISNFSTNQTLES